MSLPSTCCARFASPNGSRKPIIILVMLKAVSTCTHKSRMNVGRKFSHVQYV